MEVEIGASFRFEGLLELELDSNWSPGQDASCDEASAGWVHDHFK